MVEIEGKYRVDDLGPVRRSLAEAGGRFVGRYLESNRILDRSDGSLRAGGCGLRVRSMEALEGPAAAATVTFKGPVEASTVKRRSEIELSVGDAERMSTLLAALGYVTVLSYRKRRERWELGGCHVELDEVPLVGTFVEIEGPSEATVREVRDRIGLADHRHVKHGYVGMLWERCERIGRSMIEIDFD